MGFRRLIMVDERPEMVEGAEALSRLAGPSSEVRPTRALFLAHRVAGSGRLWMTQGLNLQSIELVNGAIVGCSGFVQLLGGISGERQFSLAEWAALAEGEGADSGQALKDVARALCRAAPRVGWAHRAAAASRQTVAVGC